MYKNYIFDFGNVLFKYNPYELCLPYVTDRKDQEIIVSTLFNLTYWNRLDDGSMNDKDYKEMMRFVVPEHLYENAMKIFDSWQDKLPEIKGMRDLVKELKSKGAKLYVLSNISISYEQNYPSYPIIKSFLDLFDGIVMSGSVKMMKPDLNIYKYLLNKYNLDPKESIFIDDKLPNVKAAKYLGMDGYCFDGDANKLKEYFKL